MAEKKPMGHPLTQNTPTSGITLVQASLKMQDKERSLVPMGLR